MIALITGFGVIGLVETVGADPDGSQRLRGMADRTFFVNVENLGTGEMGTNCYAFPADGSWADGVLVGGWVQHSNGAKTAYSADGSADNWMGSGFTLLIKQEGVVTPAHGSGILQLRAFSDIFVVELPELGAVAQFESVGEEIFGDDIYGLCPQYQEEAV
jgi:hypothetical protein